MGSIKDKINFHKIEKHIYLGNKRMAYNMELLKKYKIKRVLTLRQKPIATDLKVEGIYYKHIKVCDDMVEDILSFFPECYSFICEAQTNGENVYIHCHSGISRSTTVVIAFLMKKYGYSAQQSFQTVLLKRNCTKPNPGFQYQLILWQEMVLELNGNYKEYRSFLLTTLRNKIETQVLKLSSKEDWSQCLQNYSNIFQNYFFKLSVAESNANSLNKGFTFRCKCSKELFNEINIVNNDFLYIACLSVYIEPKEWLFEAIVSKAKSIDDLLSGDIECTDCSQKLGSFDLQLFQVAVL